MSRSPFDTLADAYDAPGPVRGGLYDALPPARRHADRRQVDVARAFAVRALLARDADVTASPTNHAEVFHVDRGYAGFVEQLTSLDADVRRILDDVLEPYAAE